MPESNRSVAPQPRIAWRFAVMVPLAVAFVVIDQIFKIEVRAAQSAGAFPIEVIRGVIGLEYVENRGAAFGLGDGFGWVFVLLAFVMVVASMAYLSRVTLVSRFEVVGLGMVCGGAVGNAIDRVTQGFVTDFLTFRFFDFPSFNVADIGITVGVVVALIGFAVLSPANAASGEEGGGGADGR